MSNETVSQDVAFRLLSHVYRRALLECLDRYDVSLSLADAAAEVARECKGKPARHISDDEIKKIYLSLHHSHVPKLAAENAVTYDRDRKSVTLTGRGEAVIALHDRVSTVDSTEVTGVSR